METNNNRNFQIPSSANPVADAEELANLLQADYIRARENPNIKIHILQSIKDRYFLAQSLALRLGKLQFYGNENFETFDCIAEAVKRCENAPEITELPFTISLDPTRKSVARQILESKHIEFMKQERSEQ